MKDNIPASPRTFDVDIDNVNDGSYPQNGMTLLDYFAAKTMQGLAASTTFNETAYEQTADVSYRLAAYMIEERKKYIP